MAAGQKLYPRATLKKIVKAHSKKNISKNVDVLVCSRHATGGTFTDAVTDIPRLRAFPTNVRCASPRSTYEDGNLTETCQTYEGSKHQCKAVG